MICYAKVSYSLYIALYVVSKLVLSLIVIRSSVGKWLGSDNYDNYEMAASLEFNSQFPILLSLNKTKYLDHG
jgi:hypothetical protein